MGERHERREEEGESEELTQNIARTHRNTREVIS